MKMNISKLPAFDELPLHEGDPPNSAWGLWSNSQLGSLNYLTSERTLDAAKHEIITGERVTLKYVPSLPLSLGPFGSPFLSSSADFGPLSLPLDIIQPGLLGRQDFEQKLVNKAPRVINDDIVCLSDKRIYRS